MKTLIKLFLAVLIALNFCSCQVSLEPSGGPGAYNDVYHQPRHSSPAHVREIREIDRRVVAGDNGNFGPWAQPMRQQRPSYGGGYSRVPVNSYGNNFSTVTRNYVPAGRNSIGWDEFNARVNGR